jgi:hypothetical protein
MVSGVQIQFPCTRAAPGDARAPRSKFLSSPGRRKRGLNLNLAAGWHLPSCLVAVAWAAAANPSHAQSVLGPRVSPGIVVTRYESSGIAELSSRAGKAAATETTVGTGPNSPAAQRTGPREGEGESRSSAPDNSTVPLSFVAEAQGLFLAVGSTANFISHARANAPLHYQWKFQDRDLVDGARIRGATTSALCISRVEAFDAGNYTLVASNADGCIISRPAPLAVYLLSMAISDRLPLGRSLLTNLTQEIEPELEHHFLPNGELRLQISGPASQRYLLEVSTDLLRWQPVASLVADGLGRALFTDPTPHWQTASAVNDPVCGFGSTAGVSAPPRPPRFYRALPLGEPADGDRVRPHR